MSKWQQVKLGDICTITSSKRFHLSERTDIGVPFYCSKEIIKKENGEEITECDFIPANIYNTIAEKYGVPQPGDILLTTRGSIGVPYLYKSGDCFYFADGNLTWLKNFNKLSLPHFLYYWFKSYIGFGKINAIAKGTAQKAVPIAEIKNIELDLPPIEVQRKIADVLSAYDDLIENNRKQIKLLEEAAQRLYKEWFIDLRFPGYETTPIIEGIPDGWERKKLGEWVNTFSGGTPSRKNKEFYQNGSNFWLKTQELTDSFIFETEEKITDRAIEYSSAKYIYPNSIIMAMYGATIGKLGIAATTLTCNQACCVFDLSSDSKKMPYLYLWLKSNRDFFISQGIGSAQSNLSQAMIKNFDIIVPCQKTLSDFSPITTKIFAKILKLQKSVNEAKNARDRLLPKLMTGELEVK